MTKQALESLSAGIILIGIGILFLMPGLSFWPWILAVIGFAGLPASLANQKGWLGWQSFFWLVGLAMLFALNALWPGILILAGISMILGALTRDDEGSPFARYKSEGNGEPFAVGDDD